MDEPDSRGTAFTADDRRPVAAGTPGAPTAEPAGVAAPRAVGTATLDDSLASDARDLSESPGSTDDGSLAALLGGVARAPSVPLPIDLVPGTEFDGTYRIVRRIGAGGMGVVYL